MYRNFLPETSKLYFDARNMLYGLLLGGLVMKRSVKGGNVNWVLILSAIERCALQSVRHIEVSA